MTISSAGQEGVDCSAQITVQGCIRDCLGVIGGSAVYDACGECDGDGTSCLPTPTPTPECEVQDLSTHVDLLTTYLKEQRRTLRQLLAKLHRISCAKEPRTKRFMKRARRKYRKAITQNDAYLSSYPVSISSCEQPNCILATTESTNESYSDRSELLYTLSKRAVARMRACRTGGECEGPVKQCRRRAIAREKDYINSLQTAEDCLTNTLTTLEVLPDLGIACAGSKLKNS